MIPLDTDPTNERQYLRMKSSIDALTLELSTQDPYPFFFLFPLFSLFFLMLTNHTTFSPDPTSKMHISTQYRRHEDTFYSNATLPQVFFTFYLNLQCSLEVNIV